MSDAAVTKPPILSSAEIDDLLSKTIIANLATLDNDGGIHILPMWFLRIGNDICIPTSHHTHKYRNLKARPRASVMIDISQAGLSLRGVLIRGRVDLLHGNEARKTNKLIHSKYVTPKGLDDHDVASYLSKGDDITIKVHMDHLVSWNLADSKAGKALSSGGWFHPLDA
ncbi:MAG: pyridoxamine 5'-phosphate oxidase family protein [Thermoproteota archaeon]|nr:pyridoxamine 5'-phosphate oxidase family protein [Thermoproteota archaeon]